MVSGTLYVETDTHVINYSNGFDWIPIAVADWDDIQFKPSTFPPSAHTHVSSDITDATEQNTADTIVKRDANGNFSAGTITANLVGNVTGNAST